MRIPSQRGPRRKRRGFGFVFIFTAMVVAVSVYISVSIRPAVEEIVAHQAKVFSTRLINSAMLEELESESFSYDSFVTVTRGENGDIESLEADMLQINRLKSKLAGSIAQKLESHGNEVVSLPAGTIIGNEFTSGRGPLVEIHMLPTGYVQTEIYNKFEAAGINQTQHQIMLGVTVQMTAILPGYHVRTEAQTNFCIAETVIVGKIPQAYASIGEAAAAFAPIKVRDSN